MPPSHPHASCEEIRTLAAGEVDRYSPDLRGFWDDLLPNLSPYPVASQNIRALTPIPCSGPLRLDHAITCPWIALNSQQRVLALCVDIDHADGPELVERLPRGCPRPTLVIDAWSGRSHAILPLATPVLTGRNARRRPIGLARLALALLAAALRGTRLPFAALVKCPTGLTINLTGRRLFRGSTPGTPLVWDCYLESGTGLMWFTQVGDGCAELWDVINALEDEYANDIARAPAPSHWRKPCEEPAGLGRNCEVFDTVRRWAYVRCERSLENIAAEVARVNAALPQPLPAEEVRSIVRSIWKFMRDKYAPCSSRGSRGRDSGVNRALDTAGRQALSGRRTAAQHKAATDEKLAQAMAALKTEGKKITQRAIAVRAKVSERSVRSRWVRIHDVADRSRRAAASAERGAAPAPWRACGTSR